MTRQANTEVLDRLHTLMHGLRRHLQDAARDDGDGLGPMEARCLGYFLRFDGASQSDLVQHSGRDKAQIARIVKALHERGLLQSTPDPDDGRCQRVTLTEQGRSMQRTMQLRRQRFERAMLAGFSDSERAQLQAQLDRMLANLDAA